MKEDDIFQTNEVQAQLSSGKPAPEPAAAFAEGIQGSEGLDAGAAIADPAPR